MNENNPLVTELMARAGGASVTEAAGAARAGSRGLGDLPARTSITVAAAVLAVVAIAATSWGLARHDDGKKSASPDAPESSEITFGPNQPATTPTTTYPTLPTFPEVSTPGFTTPTYSTASAPLPTYSTSAYSYPSSTYSYSYSPSTSTSSHTSASPTTDPTASFSATPTRVGTDVPTAIPIARCGTYGSVRVARTRGVRYELTVGDGRQGRWEVRATATTGYVIKSGATTQWSGNLGRYHKCPVVLGIKSVATQHAGEAAADPWRVTVRTTVPTKEKRELSIAYSFTTDITVVTWGGDGWSCTEPEGGDVTCTFAPAGAKPPRLSLWVNGLDPESPFSPEGTVILSADGDAVDVKSFSE